MYYRKDKKNKTHLQKSDLKLLAVFLFLIMGILFYDYYAFHSHKTLPEKLSESKAILIQMDSSLEAEHSLLEAEHQQWIKEQEGICDTANNIENENIENKHTQMIQMHAEIMARHKKLLDDYAVIERKYKNKEVENLAIQEQNETLIRDFEEIKKDHELMKVDHEKMRLDHQAMLKNHKIK